MTEPSGRQCYRCLLILLAMLGGKWGSWRTWENAVAGRLAKLVQLILVDNGVCSSTVLGPSDLAVVFAGDVRAVDLHGVDGLTLRPRVANNGQ